MSSSDNYIVFFPDSGLGARIEKNPPDFKHLASISPQMPRKILVNPYLSDLDGRISPDFWALDKDGKIVEMTPEQKEEKQKENPDAGKTIAQSAMDFIIEQAKADHAKRIAELKASMKALTDRLEDDVHKGALLIRAMTHREHQIARRAPFIWLLFSVLGVIAGYLGARILSLGT